RSVSTPVRPRVVPRSPDRGTLRRPCHNGMSTATSTGRADEEAVMKHQRFRVTGRSGAFFVWALLAFLGIQFSLCLLMDHWQLELRDPEYGYKLGRLRERLAEEPHRPLWIILGSSRSGLGFRPGVLPHCRAGDSESPILFNFALTGGGPLVELMCLR